MTHSVEDVRGWIVDQLEQNAWWRDEKAKEHPENERNEAAASMSRELAGQVRALPPVAFNALVGVANRGDDDLYRLIERMNEVIGGLGFRSFAGTGTELVEELDIGPSEPEPPAAA